MPQLLALMCVLACVVWEIAFVCPLSGCAGSTTHCFISVDAREVGGAEPPILSRSAQRLLGFLLRFVATSIRFFLVVLCKVATSHPLGVHFGDVLDLKSVTKTTSKIDFATC